jgi:hypothetical protein
MMAKLYRLHETLILRSDEGARGTAPSAFFTDGIQPKGLMLGYDEKYPVKGEMLVLFKRAIPVESTIDRMNKACGVRSNMHGWQAVDEKPVVAFEDLRRKRSCIIEHGDIPQPRQYETQERTERKRRFLVTVPSSGDDTLEDLKNKGDVVENEQKRVCLLVLKTPVTLDAAERVFVGSHLDRKIMFAPKGMHHETLKARLFSVVD